MKVLRYISNVFIDVFGITHPSPGAEDRVAWFIANMLIGVLALIVTFVFIALHYIRG